MNDINPYQSPELLNDDPVVAADELFRTGGVWRDGNYLVTTLQSHLPSRCVHYNDEAVQYETIQLTWYPSWTLVTLLLGPLFLVTLALVGRRISVNVPIGEKSLRRIPTGARWTWGCIFAGILVALGGYVLLFNNHEIRSLFVFVGIGSMLCGVAIGVNTSKKLAVHYANDQFVWLRGAGEPFLDSLPSWPINRPWM